MTPTDCHNAIIGAVQTAATNAGLSPVFPNRNANLAADQIRFDFEDMDPDDVALAGGQERALPGIATITIVSEEGVGETASAAYEAAVKSALPAGLRISATGGNVAILKTPAIRSGYPDGGFWRVPIVISYEGVPS